RRRRGFSLAGLTRPCGRCSNRQSPCPPQGASMTLRTLVFSTVAALVLALAAIAGAKTVHDGNDTTGPIDIKKAGSSKVKHGKITFVATFFEDVPPDGNTGNEYIEIWKKK